MRFLRDRLHLTGTKDGCSEGQCGSCMVLVDGQPTRSCLVEMKSLDGGSVQTVEVDEEKGSVKVLKIIAAHDVGAALNPSKIEGQLEGSCLQGQGYALTEQYRVKNGMHLTKNLAQCRIPTMKDVPDIQCIIIEDPEPKGPLGAKGISEVATVPVTPAIINAIYNAVGVRITDLPATKERILEGIKNRNAR